MYYDIVNSGERIKELRAARRMTRQQLAEQIGLSVDALRKIEAGVNGAKIDTLISIAELFHITLDYVVGQNGAMLSGGQKQKIALARALVHNSPVIIFDEATSNTDVYSEHQINGLLHTKLKEKTVIIITHKQEILKEADQIIMLKDGAVVGSGVYDDLSKDNLEFKNMLNIGEKY